MKLGFELFSQRSRLGSRRGSLARLLRNEQGSIIVYMTLAMPVLIGVAALGTEGGFWLYQKRMLQSAADNAAYSAAAAYAASTSSDITAQARAITANDYNLVNGQGNVTVAVNRPPSGSCHTGTSNYTGANAIEVIVTKPQAPVFSGIWLANDVNICGRGVAIVPSTGDCILALGTTGAGISSQGKVNNLNIDLTGCSLFSNSTSANSISIVGNNDVLTADAIGSAGGIELNGNSKSSIFNSSTGDPPVADPYATDAGSLWVATQTPAPTAPTVTTTCAACAAQTPTACTKAAPTITLNPGTYATSPINNNCTIVTMNAGTYVFSSGLTVPKGTLNIASGVTIIIPAGGFSNSGTVNFGAGNYSIYVASGGWSTGTTNFGSGNYNISVVGATAASNLTTSGSTFGNGNYTIAVTKVAANSGNWVATGTAFGTGNYTFTLGGNWTTPATLGNGNYTFAVAGNVTSSSLTMGSGTYSGSMANWTITGNTTVGKGIFYLSGNYTMSGNNQTVTASQGTTLVLTGATSIINSSGNNSNWTIAAPSTGWNAGVAIWEPNSTGSNQLANGNSSIASITGLLYAPNADVQYIGNTGATATCAQIVAKTVEFGGNSINLTGNCTSVPNAPPRIFGQVAALVE